MNFLKNIALVVVALLVSGCTGGGAGSVNFSQNAGAQITDFGFDMPSIEDFGDMAVLTLHFQNVGGKTMNGDTQLFVYNAPITLTPHSTGNTSTADDRKWLVKEPNDANTVNVSGQRIVWTLDATQFYPPDPETGQPGMSAVRRIVLEPPKQDEGMNNIPYTFEARLCYPYKSSTSSVIQSVSPDTFAEISEKKSLAETQASAGPIQVSLKAGETIRSNSAGGSTSLPLAFEVRDVGGGFATMDSTTNPCKALVEKADIGKIKVNVIIDGVAASCGDGTVYIRNGVGNLYCTGTFANQNPKSEYHIVAQSSYNYYLSRAATIRVSDSKDTNDFDES